MPTRKFQKSFSGLLILGVLIGFGLLYLASLTDLPFQAVLVVVSIALVFFSSHPLAHYFSGLVFGVRTEYFFLSRSDFRKLGGSLGKLGNAIPTIGVKFDKSQLADVSRSKRAFLFGAGAIVSNVGMLIPISLAVVLKFSLVSTTLAALFLLISLGTELLFSTKVGDLSKMRHELSLV